ncbi:MAG: hypothetical protein KDA71_24140 [Planctomycetales bacterium]|nr:hypothetical protein [Planctomycetales bacterium]
MCRGFDIRRLPFATGKRRIRYFPPPESEGGWRAGKNDNEIETIGGMDRARITALRQWLLESDNRPFAAVVIRRGTIVLQGERGNSAAANCWPSFPVLTW